jgi:transposase
MREIKRSSQFERGSGSKGHGRSRRYETYSALEDKIARVTHTFCQQAAAFAAETAKRLGCGTIFIEDYGGIGPDEDVQVRRVLDHGPLYALKQAVEHRAERDGIALKEVESAYISSKCPRCETLDAGAHNHRTGIFHCKVCEFSRPADWVAAYWMLSNGGGDMGPLHERLRREREFAATATRRSGGWRAATVGNRSGGGVKEDIEDGQANDDVRATGRRVQGAEAQVGAE